MAFRNGRTALVLFFLPIFLMATLILADAVTIISTSRTVTVIVTLDSTAPPLTNCDGVGIFTCPTGTCYTGYDGFIGCCSVSSCAARTTCIPYTTSVVQTCNVDTGGCVVCNSDAPYCVQLFNRLNFQHALYCDTAQGDITVAYTNLVTTGSLALAPGQTLSSTAVVSSSTLAESTTPPSTTSAASPGSTVTAVTTTVSDSIAIGDIGISKGTVVGVTVGSVVGVVALIGIAFVLIRRHRKRNRKMTKYDQYNKTDEFRTTDSSNAPCATTEANKLRNPPGPIVRPMATMVDVSSPDEYMFPIVRGRLVRQASRTQELDASDIGIPEAASPDLDGAEKYSPWASTPTSYNTEGNQNAQSPARYAIARYKTYMPKNNLDSGASELPGSIRHVQPSGAHQQSSSASDSPPQAGDTSGLPPPRSSPQISPNPSNYDPTPLIGGVSPLMDKWHSDDRASVGEMSATVDGPINWFSPLHIQPRPRSNEARDVAPALVSATGAGSRYVTPEEAMQFGYTAESVEGSK